MVDDRDNLLSRENGYYKLTVDEIFSKLETSIDGLSRSRRTRIRDDLGLNTIPAPNYCPSWLCCLLPCLNKTKKMKIYADSIPEFAEVKMNGKWSKIDPSGVVIGDIIRIAPGYRVPADMRVYDIPVEPCTFNTLYTSGKSTPKLSRLEPTIDESLVTGRNHREPPSHIALAGSLCNEGECIGIVIAIGENTVMGRMVTDREWPAGI